LHSFVQIRSVIVELPVEISRPVQAEARRSRVPPQKWVLGKLAEVIEDLEDLRIAKQRSASLKSGNARPVSSVEAKHALGI
jgi:predicted DNA-binding protein